MGGIIPGTGDDRSPPPPPVEPAPVVPVAPVVKAGTGMKEATKKKAKIRRGVPRRLSSSVLGSVAGETTKAKLGD
tara:strand:- start:2545 stop:2769 length:225 start_codon:yes stop_codon:yes gene_type:complete